ncbi:MAG: DUF3617 family protein, partial [Pseudorhodoplanes sp.]
QTERIEAGLWKVTTNLIMNGAPMPVEIKNRCLSAEQAGDPAKTFSPEVASVNTECKTAEQSMQAGRLKWHMQCRGQIDIDVTGDFTFDSAKHYSATVATKAFMAGQKVADSSAAIEGEHTGACP